MAVDYDDLEGSPTLNVSRSGTTGVRILKIAWADVGPFLDELYPYNGFYNDSASFPNLVWLKVDTVAMEPYVPDGMKGNGEAINTYDGGAKVTINYKSPQFDRGVQSGGTNQSGPGGAAGSTGGQTTSGGGSGDGSGTLLVSHEIDFAGQFLSIPSASLKWDSDSKQCGEDVQAGKLICQTDHTITWNAVARPPFDAIRKCRGHINDAPIAGARTGTALFVGAKCSQETKTTGADAWKVVYKILEKDTDPLGATPQGWNFFWRSETGDFELVKTKTGGRIFKSANFKNLFVQAP